MPTDFAVQAAAEAHHQTWCRASSCKARRNWHSNDYSVAELLVAAARPHIAAEVRAEAAAAIRAEVDAHAPAGGIAAWRNNGLTAAARIAEGGTR